MFVNNSVSKVLALSMGAGLITVAQVQADPLILGSIDFAGLGLTPFTMNHPDAQHNLANATAFTSISAYVSSASGSYTSAAFGGTGPVNTTFAGVLPSTSVTFTDFTFIPPQAPPNMLLWTVVDDGVTYTFTASTLTAVYSANSGQSQWLFSGLGYASITGYANTEGVWQLSASESLTGSAPIVSFGFDSQAVASGSPIPSPSPDGGMTAMLLGGSLLGIGFLSKKAKRSP